VIQEERSIFWEGIVYVIVRKTFIWTCVYRWTVTEVELFDSTNTKPLWMIIKKEK
jgi:hypothetical protein